MSSRNPFTKGRDRGASPALSQSRHPSPRRETQAEEPSGPGTRQPRSRLPVWPQGNRKAPGALAAEAPKLQIRFRRTYSRRKDARRSEVRQLWTWRGTGEAGKFAGRREPGCTLCIIDGLPGRIRLGIWQVSKSASARRGKSRPPSPAGCRRAGRANPTRWAGTSPSFAPPQWLHDTRCSALESGSGIIVCPESGAGRSGNVT